MDIFSLRNGRENTGRPPSPGFAHTRLLTTRHRPVYSLMLGTKTFIVLSSDVAIKDLLDKRSNIYSSRPDMLMGPDIASGGLRILLMVGNVPICFHFLHAICL